MLKSSVLSIVIQKQVSVYTQCICEYSNDYNDGKLEEYLCIGSTFISVTYYCQV